MKEPVSSYRGIVSLDYTVMTFRFKQSPVTVAGACQKTVTELLWEIFSISNFFFWESLLSCCHYELSMKFTSLGLTLCSIIRMSCT